MNQMDTRSLKHLIQRIIKEALSDKDLAWWTDYYKNKSFDSPEEAKTFVFQQREYATQQGWGGTPEENKQFANDMPISKIGKKFKIGSVASKPSFDWQTVEIKPNDTETLASEGWLNIFDGERLGRTRIVPIDKLVSTENHAQTSAGKQKVKTIVSSLKSNDAYFVPVVVDESGNIVDGHHRYEAAKVLKTKTIPVQVILGRK
jgi:hypothetical protein